MEAVSPLCIICGADIPYRHMGNSWRREFRAIRCKTNPDLDGQPFLTGVGGYIPRNRPVSAPSDPDKRWDDAGYIPPREDAFPPLIGVPRQPSPGFIFHETCWTLLQKMLNPHPVDIKRFYNICLSCPAHKKGWLDWGHDYGSLMDRLPMVRYPWEDVYVVGYIKRYLGDEDSPLTFFKSDPLHVPELQQALEASRERQDSISSGPISPVFREKPDCFERLPQELLEYIQLLLPSHSVSSLRRVSRSFASLPLNQLFWASRFERSQERGFVYEATDPVHSNISEQRGRDWKTLYRKTTLNAASSREMMNRKRIWESTKDLADLLLQKPLTDAGLERSKHGVLGEMPQGKDKWRAAGGDFASRSQGHSPSGMPCRAIFEQTVSVPENLRHITVSMCTFGGKQYISGLRFISDQEEDVLMGYVLPEKEIYVDIRSSSGQYSKLNGFIVAIGPRGLHALRTTTTAGQVSSWAGCPDGLPQTIRLCMRKPITSLRAFFDGFKMVSLAVPTDSEPLFGDDPTHEHLPLRATGLWYPSVPAAHLQLHDAAFAGRNVSLYEYRPLVQVMFGGPQGRYLKHLTKISVTVSKAAIVGIDFFYSGEDAPFKRLRACQSTASADDSVKTPFSIDGPAGELLTGIQVDGDFFLSSDGPGSYRYGAITSLKVITNRNRTFVFQPSAIPLLKLPSGPHVRQKPKKVEITASTTITGIYFMHDPSFGMISMGPISEDLNGDPPLDKDIDAAFADMIVRDEPTELLY